MSKYTGDFETTSDFEHDKVWVWAWALCRIGDPDDFTYGHSIDEFMHKIESMSNPTIYFHNAKYDFEYIIHYLLSHGFDYIEDKKDRHDKSFTTLITDTGLFYSMEVWFKVGNKKVKHVKFYDSLKILNFSVDKIAKDFHLPVQKLEMDYLLYRGIDHQFTAEELEYLKNDVVIMSMALNIVFKEGLTKMTIGSNALSNFKKTCKGFDKLFPIFDFEIDKELRKSYKGGFTYLNDLYQGKTTGSGVVFDKNSMYPAKMKFEKLPFSIPHPFEGKYQFDHIYDLYVQTLSCSFVLKEGKIPSIQLKNSPFFKQNEYIKSSDGQILTLTLTSPDLELFLEQYDISDVTYHGGWKFRSINGLFNEYIDYWTSRKIESKKAGNGALYTISKLMLNSLYGKFGLNPVTAKKYPVLEDGRVHYHNHEMEIIDPIYVCIAAFITAYARADIIRSSQVIRDFTLKKHGFDGYIYSDTDSIHAILDDDDIEELKSLMDIDDYRLGAWKLESKFRRGKYLRQKCYIEEDYDGKINVTVAGLPKKLSHLINFDNFEIGFTTANFTDQEIGKAGRKLTYRHSQGGVMLVDTDFTIV